MGSLFEEKVSSRRKAYYKKGLTSDESRRKREDGLLDLRKTQRDDVISKRRQARNDINLSADSSGLLNDVTESISVIPQLYQNIMSDDHTRQLESTIRFRKLLSIERNPPIQEVIDSNAVPRLVEFLKREDNEKLQFEAAWAITNIASGSSTQTYVIVESGAVPIFVTLLRSVNPDVREQAVWALGNIAGDSTECRDLVLKLQGLPSIVSLCIPDSKLSMLRNATWTLSNLCRGKPQPMFELISPALHVLARLLSVSDEEILTDACWALAYISDDTGPENKRIQSVIESGVCPRLVEILKNENANNTLKTPALRVIGNLVTGNDYQTQSVINSGALIALKLLLNNDKKSIRKETCWTISNITAGNTEQIQAVFDHNFIPPLVELLTNATFDIKKEAAWAISNATSGGSKEQIKFLVTQGVIAPLCSLFGSQDVKIEIVALEGIENILRVGEPSSPDDGENQYSLCVESAGGLDKIEELQNRDSDELSSKAMNVIAQYFNGVEEDFSARLEPESDEEGFTFGGAFQPGQGFHF